MSSDELPANAPTPENSIVLRRPSKQTPGTSVEVRTVVDGDTFVAQQGDRLYLMTLRDVEAPELDQPDGPAARDRLAARIVGKRIVVWTGKPDGCIVPVLAETSAGSDVAETLLDEGFLWASRSAPEAWRRLESRAREARLGLWIGSQPEPPWEFRVRR